MLVGSKYYKPFNHIMVVGLCGCFHELISNKRRLAGAGRVADVRDPHEHGFGVTDS